MNLSINPINESELIHLYELYRLANEPDSPKVPFSFLSKDGKQEAMKRFDIQSHFTVYNGKECIGFLGIYVNTPYANIFYIFNESQRGKGYLSPVLNQIKNHCLKILTEVEVLVAVTQPQNLASIRGLEKSGFQNEGEIIDSGVKYLEYSFQLKR